MSPGIAHCWTSFKACSTLTLKVFIRFWSLKILQRQGSSLVIASLRGLQQAGVGLIVAFRKPAQGTSFLVHGGSGGSGWASVVDAAITTVSTATIITVDTSFPAEPMLCFLVSLLPLQIRSL